MILVHLRDSDSERGGVSTISSMVSPDPFNATRRTQAPILETLGRLNQCLPQTLRNTKDRNLIERVPPQSESRKPAEH